MYLAIWDEVAQKCQLHQVVNTVVQVNSLPPPFFFGLLNLSITKREILKSSTITVKVLFFCSVCSVFVSRILSLLLELHM